MGCNEGSPRKTERAGRGGGAGSRVPDGSIAATGTLAGSGADALVVEVDGAQLTEADVDRQMERAFGPGVPQGVPAEEAARMKAKMRSEMIAGFVAETVLVNEANRKNVSVSDDDVTKEIANMKSKLPPGLTFEQALGSRGMTEAELRKELGRDMRVRKLLDAEVGETAQPTEDEVAAFYKENAQRFQVPETVKARHILIKCEESADAVMRAEKKAVAEKCRQELIAGADFSDMALKNSDCPSRNSGGDLGTFGRGQMVKPFENAAFSQKTNEIGSVVETSFGYHVIQVQAHSEPKAMSLGEVRTNMVSAIQRRKRRDAVMGYIDRLKSAAKVRYGGAPPAPR
jgi:peptidyl-prolyl cis-trans isomerase C